MTAVDHFNEGTQYYSQGKYEAALACFEQSIMLDPQYALAWYGKGGVYVEQGQYEKALTCFDQSITLDPQYASTWFEKGRLYKKQRQYEKALAYFEQSIALDPQNAYSWHGKGAVYERQRRYGEAFECFKKSTALDPQYASPWCGIGNVYYKQEKYKEAFDCYKKALEIDVWFASAWDGIGDIYVKEGKYEEALKSFEKSIALDANNVYPWCGIGSIYATQERYEEALKSYKRSIVIDPRDADPWCGIGSVFYDQAKYEEALESYERATALNPMSDFPWYGKGNVYYDQGKFEEALTCYEQSIELDPKNATSWYRKGMAYYGLEQFDDSLKAFIRSSFLQRHIGWNGLVLLSIYPQAPFYAFDLLQLYYYQYSDYDRTASTNIPNVFSRWERLNKDIVNQCEHLLIYRLYLEFHHKNKELKNWEWIQWLGLVDFFMVHPIRSLEQFKKVLRIKKTDLFAHYYLIQSCFQFFEPEEEYLLAGLAIAEKIKPKKQKLSLFKRKKQKTDNEIQQLYYAGQLLLLDEEPEEALIYFEAIKKEFLPAAYMCLQIKYDQTGKQEQSLVKLIYKMEQKVWGTHQSYAGGMPEQYLDLGLINFRAPFFQYAHYEEIRKGIKLFYYAARQQKLKNIQVVNPDTLKSFWYTWKLSIQQIKQIYNEANAKRKANLVDELLNAREVELERRKSRIEVDPESLDELISLEESEHLTNAYRMLKAEPNAKELEKRMVGMINEWPKSRFAQLYTLTSIFALDGKISEKQKIYLDFYTIIRDRSNQILSDVILAGCKDEFKVLIGSGIDLMGNAIGFTGIFIDLLLKPFAKGSLSQLIMNFLKRTKPTFNSYKEFRETFRVFIGEEKDRLGDKFDQVYPMYGFEDWIEEDSKTTNPPTSRKN